MKTQAVLKVFKSGEYDYIYIYYKLGSNMLRINTGNKFVKSYMNADLTYTKKMTDHESLNFSTSVLMMKVNAYITRKLQYHKPTVNQKECQLWLQGKYDEPYSKAINLHVNKNRTLLDFYADFYLYKQKQLNHEPSYKDYGFLQLALTNYQTSKNTVLNFQDIDTTDFMVEFRKYLSDLHEGTLKGNFKGGLNDNTIYKRFVNLKTFMKYIEEKELYTFKPSTKDFKLQKYDNEIIVLSKDDIKQILAIETTNAAHQRIIDLFVFNCFAGLRFSDLSTLKPENFIKDIDGDYTIVKENKKTGITSYISLQQTGLTIAKKYNFQLPTCKINNFDGMLHDIFEAHNLFNESITKKKRNLKVNNDYIKLKRDCITSHTCRRTFITLSFNANVPITSIMKASGHKRLETVQKYAKQEQNKKAFKAIDL